MATAEHAADFGSCNSRLHKSGLALHFDVKNAMTGRQKELTTNQLLHTIVSVSERDVE